jgi:hypothetical protein
MGTVGGGGAITKFARVLAREGRDVGLGIYIDAFTFRNRRVPPNVRYAVNMYQRTGLLRGFPLRGPRQADRGVPERHRHPRESSHHPGDPAFRMELEPGAAAAHRQHHRIGHDERIQRFLIDLVSAVAVPSAVELPAGANPQP